MIPPSQPSPVLARSHPVPGPSGLLVCGSQSHTAQGLRRECTRSRSSSGEARGEQRRDRSRSVGSRVRTCVSCSRSSSRSPSVRSRSRRRRSQSSDRYRYREDRSRSCGDRSRSRRERSRSSCRRRSLREHTRSRRDRDRSRDRLRSLDRSNLSPDRSRSRERYRRRWCMNRREHGRHSSASHVHGHSGSCLSAHADAPSASEPALLALANLLVGLTTACDSSGGVWSNTFLAGAVPGAGPGLGSSIPGAVPVPSVSAGASVSVGVPPARGSSTTGPFGVGGPSRELPRSKRSHERSPARAMPVLGDALPLLPAILARFRRPLLPRLLLWERSRQERSAPLPLEGLVVQ